MTHFTTYWLLGVTIGLAFLLTLLLTPLVRRLALAVGRVAYPKSDRWHKRPTALLGGVAIFCGIAGALAFTFSWSQPLVGAGLGIGAIFILGLIDDFLAIPPFAKLVGQLISAVIPVFFGIRIELFADPVLTVLVTMAWIVVMTNAFNLLDNMDGLSAGTAAIAALVLATEAVTRGDAAGAGLALAVGGAALGFLPYNFHPARIFMGDCGSMVLGYALAVVSIAGPWRDSTNLLLTLAVPFLVLAIPLFDTMFVTITRTMSRRPISQGGRDHTSHRLVFLGLPEPKAVLLLYALSLGMGALALFAASQGIYTMLVIVAGVVIFLFFFGVFLGEIKVYEARDSFPEGEAVRDLTLLNTVLLYKRQIAEVIIDTALITAAYLSAHLLRFEGQLGSIDNQLLMQSLAIVIGATLAAYLYFGLYHIIWRYAGLRDLVNIFKAVTLATLLSTVALVYINRFSNYSRSVFIIHAVLLFLFTAGTRVLVRLLREVFGQAIEGGHRILIYGAGDAGELLAREILHHRSREFKLVGFIDDDPRKLGRQIHGLSVMGTPADLERIKSEKSVKGIIIAIPSAGQGSLKSMHQACTSAGLEVYRMHPTIN